MTRKLLHLLSQRPSLTGSGITLDALVRQASRSGWEQRVVVGTPIDDPNPMVGGLPTEEVIPIVFGQGELDFSLPGMSDVMPYVSSRWSDLDAAQLDRYRRVWRSHLRDLLERFSPDVIHSHHLWLMSSIIKDVCPEIPVVTHCHATGLRQMSLCPHLSQEIVAGLRRNERFVVLYEAQAQEVIQALDIEPERVSVVGAGFRDELFNTREADQRSRAHLLYAGKLARAKGVPWLLEAVSSLASKHSEVVLHVAGGGAGAEAESLLRRMEELEPTVQFHGRLDQQALAGLMRRCSIFVLPSFYEGLPLVLVEALACGCRLVCTSLPAVEREISPHLGSALEMVPLPRLESVDRPVDEDLPVFQEQLEAAIERSLGRNPLEITADSLTHFTWRAVYRRIEIIWEKLF